MRLAALFPGQGSQFVGMGRDVARAWREAGAVFDEVDDALDGWLSRVCWEGPEEELKLTANTQPALLAHSIAVWRVLRGLGLPVTVGAGHSLGEYSAVVAAGGLELGEAARLVRRRGELMQDAVPVGEGGMAAILGLDDDAVATVCDDVAGVVVPANFNAPGQVVIAGAADAVKAAVALARERGARRAVPLPVSAPFHSPLMVPARRGLEPYLNQVDLSDPAWPIVRNVDAAPAGTAAEVRDGLIRQVDSPVLWTATIRRMIDDGVDTFVEIGAGSVLRGLVRRIDRTVSCSCVGTADEIGALAETLGR